MSNAGGMIRAVLTDIEGTTSSLSFVKDVLFPYARARMADFVAARAGDPEVERLLDEAGAEAGGGLTREAVVARLIEWIDADRKVTPLKALQGLLWEEGYRRGDFRGHVYPDAAAALRRWRDAGLSLYVYSSGSVQAQRLLFGHTELGDLTPLFDGYFDTTTGPKTASDSYRRIAAAVGLAPGEILFLSDVRAELDAAATAGMATRWLVRDGRPEAGGAHVQVGDFDAIDPMAG